MDLEELKKRVSDPRGEPASGLIMEKLRENYTKREVESPVDFVMELTMMLMRQSPPEAAKQLSAWAKRRLDLTITEDEIKTSNPSKIRERLLAGSKAVVDSGRLEKEIQDALACKTDADLEKHLQDRFGARLPDSMRYLDAKDRSDAIRARVESIVRGELLHFEQEILLNTLDDSWRGHLHSMDQLRDVISFRAYSQQDPRTEFKREGSRTFLDMLETVRERITDHIFRARLSPQMLGFGQPGVGGGIGGGPGGLPPGPGGPRPAPRVGAGSGGTPPLPTPGPKPNNTLFPFIPATGAPGAGGARPAPPKPAGEDAPPTA